MSIDPIAKILFTTGVVLIVIGLFWQFGWIQYLKLGQLPGDIRIEKENYNFYFPLTTCILLSLVLGFLSWIFRK